MNVCFECCYRWCCLSFDIMFGSWLVIGVFLGLFCTCLLILGWLLWFIVWLVYYVGVFVGGFGFVGVNCRMVCCLTVLLVV